MDMSKIQELMKDMPPMGMGDDDDYEENDDEGSDDDMPPLEDYTASAKVVDEPVAEAPADAAI